MILCRGVMNKQKNRRENILSLQGGEHWNQFLPSALGSGLSPVVACHIIQKANLNKRAYIINITVFRSQVLQLLPLSHTSPFTSVSLLFLDTLLPLDLFSCCYFYLKHLSIGNLKACSFISFKCHLFFEAFPDYSI